MRYEPNDDAFAGDFIEFSDSWSRAQLRAVWASVPEAATAAEGDDAEDALLKLLRPKIVKLHLTCVDAPPITDPNDLTPARTEQMDTRLYAWFAATWMVHLNGLSNLGNALRQGLLTTSVTSSSNGTAKTATPARRSRKS